FLGTSLHEDYFINLFGETLDLCGPSAVPHFAFAEAGQVDASFLADQMNITVCEFGKGQFEKVAEWLTRLRDDLEHPKVRNRGWSFTCDETGGYSAPDLEIIPGDVPSCVESGETVAFIAKRDEQGAPIRPRNFEWLQSGQADKVPGHHHVFYYAEHD